MMGGPLERIRDFERELALRTSTRTERCRFGTAFFHEGFPRRWDSNFVWADAPLDGATAAEVAADVDDVLGRAGLDHRTLWIEDARHAERLAPGLARLGYGVDRNVVMVHAREPDRWTDERAEELDLAGARPFHVAQTLEVGLAPEDAEMLADFRGVLREHAGARFFGVVVDDEVVAGCDLYRIGDVAQVEDVYTLAEHRGRGHARAAVLAAVRAARDAGAGLVFLGADDEDWPKHLYAKLGFDVVDRSVDFVRKPPAERSPLEGPPPRRG